MHKFNSYEAKHYFSQLMTKIANGDEIIIVRSGQDFAKITPLKNETKRRIAGRDRDHAWVDEEFNEPLPDKLLSYFS